MRNVERQPKTVEQMAELLYKSLLRRKNDIDPRLWPLALLEWERLPSLSKAYLAEALSDVFDDL